MIEVTLETYELETATVVGVKRRLHSILKKHKSFKERDLSGWGEDVEASCAEMAAAKALNVYYGSTYNTYKTVPDIGRNYEVRSSTNPEAKLVVRPKDNPDAIYILVTGTLPTYKVHGYYKGSDAMNKENMMNPGGRGIAFFIPQDKLKPIEELINN